MSLSTTTRRTLHTITTGVTTYPVGFSFFEAEHLLVTILDVAGDGEPLTLDSHYTVSGAGRISGGTVRVLIDPLPVGDTLVVERVVPAVQGTDMSNLGEAYPEVVEAALDYITQYLQQVETLLGTQYGSEARVPKLYPNDVDGSGAFDCGSNRLANADDPIDDQDVATRAYVSRAVAGVTGGGAAGSWISGTVTLLADLPTAAVEYEDQIWKIADPVAPRMFKVCMRQSDGTSFAWETLVAAGT